jgi:hypothetical protein
MQYLLGNASASTYESLDQSSEEWLAECLNDTEMNFSSDDMYASLDLKLFSVTTNFVNLIPLLCETQEFHWVI